jgi:DNA replication protein DnaC
MSDSFRDLIARMQREAAKAAADAPSADTDTDADRDERLRSIRVQLWGAARIPARLRRAKVEDLAPDLRRAVVDWLRGTGSSLLLLGAVGCGKSYAAVAVGREAIRRLTPGRLAAGGFDTRPPVLFANWPDVAAAARTFKPPDPVARLARFGGLLILDDLAAGSATDFGRESLYRVIDRRWRDNLRLVATADLAPDALAARLGDRIASRLMSGAVLRVAGGDRRLNRR